MEALNQLFTSLSFQNVETDIQCSNVFFLSKKPSEENPTTVIAKEIKKFFTLNISLS